MKLGIAKKLFILFFFFLLIFYGTVFESFINVQAMSKTSDRIVSVNNQITSLSKKLQDSLMSMDANDKKFRLLKKKVYFNYFETARKDYIKKLDQILNLDLKEKHLTGKWKQIQKKYQVYTTFRPLDNFISMQTHWGDDILLDEWLGAIAIARETNENQIEQALIEINDRSRHIVKNGLIGFGISILASILGVIVISKSILKPLNKLKAGLQGISHDNYNHVIQISSNDEFSELAAAFNNMSQQLKEDEDIRSDFIASLSHEIRTPLSSIRESVNLVIEEVLGPVNKKQRKFLRIASSEITRISSLLNHLLDTSMLESNVTMTQPKPLDPNQLIKEASLRLASTAKVSNVSISLHELKSAPMVMGERKEVMQVLLNIIGNAIKFSYKNNTVDITILKNTNYDGICFKISDKGPGIPEEKHFLIFKKYYRAKEVRNHMDGVGLGLNISKRIIHAHGGTIFVKNNDDKGCSFFFTLPVEKKKPSKG